MQKSILGCMILIGMAWNTARTQEIKPVTTLNDQLLTEKTVCFQLSPQETKSDFLIPADAYFVYSKINWTGGAPVLHVALVANELRRPKTQWEGDSPLERDFKLEGETTQGWYLKITNPSTFQSAFGCCTFYYTRKVELKRGFAFDATNINPDTNKITYAKFIGIDRSAWGTGTFQITPDGEMGISYENGNYLKYMGAKGMLIKQGDSTFMVTRPPYFGGIPLSPLLSTGVPNADMPPAPTEFVSSENQKWYFGLYWWTNDLNGKLSNLPPFLFKAFELGGESDYMSTLKGHLENKDVFFTHDFLIDSIDIILMQAKGADKNKKPGKIKEKKN